MRAEGWSDKKGLVGEKTRCGEYGAENDTFEGHIDAQVKMADAASIFRDSPVGEVRLDTSNSGRAAGKTFNSREKGRFAAFNGLWGNDKKTLRSSQKRKESSGAVGTVSGHGERVWKSLNSCGMSTEAARMDDRSDVAKDIEQLLPVARPVRSLNMELTCPICLGILQVSELTTGLLTD